MKIYTKTGDKGQTSLLGGKRLPKNDIRIEAYGCVDELNSYMGVLRDSYNDSTINSLLITIQDRLFTIGSILAAAGDTSKFKIPAINEDDILLLEKTIDSMNEELEPMRNFILPGGCLPASHAHVCRTVCRRAERRCVELASAEEVPDILIKYLNRLSDYFFVLSRFISKKSGSVDTPWQPKM
jgi:cob(I)alamin adenosyltransferase